MKLRTFPKIKEVLNFGLTKNWPLYAISPSCAGRTKAAKWTIPMAAKRQTRGFIGSTLTPTVDAGLFDYFRFHKEIHETDI